MGAVNNFITDLIDEMEALKASDLLLVGGRVPYYSIRGGEGIDITSYGSIPAEEIFEDMAALGLSVEDEGNFIYLHPSNGGNGDTWRMRVATSIEEGKPFVFIRIIPHSIKAF